MKKPFHLRLGNSDKHIIEEHQKYLSAVGFRIDSVETGFVISHIPLVCKGRNIEKFFREIIDDLSQDIPLPTIDQRSHRMLAYLACRSAVKSGDVLSHKQMEDILQSLEKTPHDTTCPHGRPTRIVISRHVIDKAFLRR